MAFVSSFMHWAESHQARYIADFLIGTGGPTPDIRISHIDYERIDLELTKPYGLAGLGQ